MSRPFSALADRIYRIYRDVVGWLRPLPTEFPPPSPPPVASKERQGAARKGEDGQFYFRETILDRLPLCFKYLRRLRKSDRDAYDLYSKFGMALVPDKALFQVEGIDPYFLAKRPAFVAAMMRHDETDDDDESALTFVYITKYDPHLAPPDLERVSLGDVYIASFYLDWTKTKKYRIKKGVVLESAVVVSEDGVVRPLRSLIRSQTHVRSKRKRDTFSIPIRKWGIHNFYRERAKERGISPEQYIVGMFTLVANSFALPHRSMIRVDIESEGLHAVIGVDIKRTPYFFKDRDLTVTEGGRRRRIFHIVRPHQRASGAAVKMHFRGQRQFVWNGYNVSITVPGRDHTDVREIDIRAIDVEAAEKHGVDVTKTVGMKKLGSWLLQKTQPGGAAS